MSENRVIQHHIYKNKQILLFIKPQFSVLKLTQWLCSGRQPFPSGLPEGSHLRTSFLAVWLLFSFPLPTGPPHIQSLTDLLAQGFEAGFLVGLHEKGKPSFRWILSLWGVLFPASGFLCCTPQYNSLHCLHCHLNSNPFCWQCGRLFDAELSLGDHRWDATATISEILHETIKSFWALTSWGRISVTS